ALLISTSFPHPYLPSFPTRRSSDLDPRHSRPGVAGAVPSVQRAARPRGRGKGGPPHPGRRARDGATPPGGGQAAVMTVTAVIGRSEEHTSELQSHLNLVCRLLLAKK